MICESSNQMTKSCTCVKKRTLSARGVNHVLKGVKA